MLHAWETGSTLSIRDGNHGRNKQPQSHIFSEAYGERADASVQIFYQKSAPPFLSFLFIVLPQFDTGCVHPLTCLTPFTVAPPASRAT